MRVKQAFTCRDFSRDVKQLVFLAAFITLFGFYLIECRFLHSMSITGASSIGEFGWSVNSFTITAI